MPRNLVVQAKDTGSRAIALTDKNGLYGAIRFYKAALDHRIKPIIGTEATRPTSKASRAYWPASCLLSS